jgi:hypothetical protein
MTAVRTADLGYSSHRVQSLSMSVIGLKPVMQQLSSFNARRAPDIWPKND